MQEWDLTELKNPEKWVAGLGLPLVWRTKPSEPPGCLIFGGFTDCPHPHKQETRGMAISLLSRKF